MFTFENEFNMIALGIYCAQTPLVGQYNELSNHLEDDTCATLARNLDDVLFELDQAMKHLLDARDLITVLEKQGVIEY